MGWDGRLWPEITGYRGHELTVEDHPAEVTVETATPKAGTAKVGTPKVKPPRLFEVIELKNAAEDLSAPDLEVERRESAAISEPEVDVVPAAKRPMSLYVALVLVLALVALALILGVGL